MSEKPKSVIKSVNLIISKLQHLTPEGEVVDAMNLNTLPNRNGNFIDDVNNRLDAIETLLNTVNDKLTILTSQ